MNPSAVLHLQVAEVNAEPTERAIATAALASGVSMWKTTKRHNSDPSIPDNRFAVAK